jgi:prepilin-type N-terminal cleavage/methylation domain-containing protein
MKRTAFTLVELIISIFLLGLIVTFLYSSLGNLQKSNEFLASKQTKLTKRDMIVNVLYDDIFLSDPASIKIRGIENSIIDINTTNSLYDIEKPSVAWLIEGDQNTLLRFESVMPFSRMNSDNEDLYHISKVAENCEKFKVYRSKKKDKILVHLKLKDQEPIIFEFFKPAPIVAKKRSSKKPPAAGGKKGGSPSPHGKVPPKK